MNIASIILTKKSNSSSYPPILKNIVENVFVVVGNLRKSKEIYDGIKISLNRQFFKISPAIGECVENYDWMKYIVKALLPMSLKDYIKLFQCDSRLSACVQLRQQQSSPLFNTASDAAIFEEVPCWKTSK